MRKLALIILAALVSFAAKAQVQEVEYVDSLVFTPIVVLDSTVVGKNIFYTMPEGVTVHQSSGILSMMSGRAEANGSREVSGYRIRIFLDNGQNARKESESALYRFKTKFPEISAYRSFASPFFKVTVGDFRTRSEAMAALADIQKSFPSSFIVKEKFRFPAIEGEKSFRIDTIKVAKTPVNTL